MRQALPFQRSATASTPPGALSENPTAVQAFGEVHDTALRFPPVEPLGVGMAWTRQLVPFHASARFTLRRAAFSKAEPTAVQAVADAQDTPLKALPSTLLGTMVG